MDSGAIGAALVSYDGAVRDLLRQCTRDSGYELGLEVPAAFNEIGKEQLLKLRELRPEVVILDFGGDPKVGVHFAHFLAETDPELRILALGPALAPELLLDAMRAGITEYLPTPGREALAAALGRVARKLRRGGGGAREPGKLFTLFSAKGGTGNTTAATNLAVQLHSQTGKRTLLIDLDLELGETALLLGVQPRFNFVDMVKNFHRMDANLLASYIERHDTGVELLSAPVQPERVEMPTREEVGAVLRFLKQHFDFIVVDTSKSSSPATRAALEQSELILLVVTPDLPALRNAKRSLPLLEGRRGEGEPRRVRLVVNRYDPDNLITLNDIRETLELDVAWSLSSDYRAISESVNRGVPIVSNGSSRYARDIRALGAGLAGLSAPEAGRRGAPFAPLGRVWQRIFQRTAGDA
jgi:pilus assembly protein CpaE